MTHCFVVDTYAWLEYLGGNVSYKQLMDETPLKTPIIVLAELSRVFRRRGVKEADAQRMIENISGRSVILPLDSVHAVGGGALAENEKLALVDAIIYSYASNDEKLLTGDEHFRGKKNVLLVK
ncbi:hypothetical protein COT30_04125 [Candidatus Micrarchaeota archaeon CG08_land_8_20_14_0_20_49_17]|nr:MAG: hypothetical protein AUJ13_01525 [Candidatus Micrarchaeota archaeon CG1_02_49_24]PIU09497.1 MAG: hypothetical protein COT30_04125 [Candidatus Micrarchaeota archaeon CG08_land_8_20_14_0_20_49_17]PIU81246.1 MAG: hypothetical protein COS70_05120 [Candidatus Micrarchaeota archaeon CG06_land_8_20_14_3_00_50_6]PIZ95903.1 MAG: hypothetical protein COX84_04210 [Candidatus Micrarchaeota archaeon CG_4_10_14_0_2_um_filter_49_7]HII54206.1 type II toxin-antitoxin system VapC family toxin [Candidatus